jgi:hypothetical protein
MLTVKTLRTHLVIAACAAALSAPLAIPAYAGHHEGAEAHMSHVTDQAFTKKSFKIAGNWSLVERDGQTFISFNDSFKTKKGPDLKIFLSPQTIADVNGKTALNGAVLLGELQSNKGAQEYLVPAGTDLSSFNSVLVHCEAYSKLWGGGDLKPNTDQGMNHVNTNTGS